MNTTAKAKFIEVWMEGKTDWRILKRAQEKLGISLNLSFHETDKAMGDKHLLDRCKTFAEKPNEAPIVFIFDREDRSTVVEVSDPTGLYKSWGNNVFSFVLPVPEHRLGHENISIEFYFTDADLQTKDGNGRRLYLTSEFNEKSGRLLTDPNISIGTRGFLRGYTEPRKARIVDTDVHDNKHSSLALSKADFAECIVNDIPPFNGFDFRAFSKILDILALIGEAAIPKTSIYFPHPDHFYDSIKDLPAPECLSRLYDMLYNILIMALQIFCVTTIRRYENELVAEPAEYRKKARQVKKLLSERFRWPSFATWVGLAEQCFYLVDATAPEELARMKACLDAVIVLEDIGQFIDDLEKLFPPKAGTPIFVKKTEIRRELIRFVFPELAKYADISRQLLEEKIQSGEQVQPNPESWVSAIKHLADQLEPMYSNMLVLTSLEKVDTKTGQYLVSSRAYSQSGVHYSENLIPIEEAQEYQSNTTYLLLSDRTRIHLFPFMLIKDDSLYYYNRTLVAGYEYYSIIDDHIYIKETKKKFNHAVFKTGSEQELFWTEALPTVNEINGIRANIPDEQLSEFVGRRRQINMILDEIIEIPNQNGIVYGLGGIGKTALMLQLSKVLYENPSKEEVLFDNIIWASAKSDYYDYVFDAVEQREPQAKSLDSVLFAVLRFFEFENLEEYDIDDKKWFVLELLQDHRTLLILDNFETIPPGEQDKIIRFFDVEVKKSLRRKPGHFKVVITSRKQIPCGFHQIELKGLDLRESRLLMENLYRRYTRASNQMLSDEQQEMVHEATKGIPIVIKHSFAKLYEYNEALDTVVRKLGQYASEIVQFSFAEILQQVEKRDRDQVQLKILLLLELINYPLMARQIADILEIDELTAQDKIPTLIGFQCLRKVNQKDQEKYVVNEEIRLLTRSLEQQHDQLSQGIRQKILSNFSIERQLDYTADEYQIVGIFENYLAKKEFLDAEDFIKTQLKERSTSVLINYHYARYLKERKRDFNQAISILEKLRELYGNHPSILRLLSACYISLDIPNYETASAYVSQLEKLIGTDDDLKLDIAEFYIKWSTNIKTKQAPGFDPLDEGIRQSNYKNLAEKGIDYLNSLTKKTHRAYQLLAQGFLNMWDYDKARLMIDKAISLVDNPNDYSLAHYRNLRRIIVEKADLYSKGKKR